MKISRNDILLILVVFMAAWILRGLIPAGQPKTYLKEFLASKDSSIAQSHRREIQYLQEAKEERERASQLQSKDTVYIRQLISNDKKIKTSNDRVDAIPDSELERAITNHYNR